MLGKDARTGLITTTYDTVRRLYLDPAAATLDDVDAVYRTLNTVSSSLNTVNCTMIVNCTLLSMMPALMA